MELACAQPLLADAVRHALSSKTGARAPDRDTRVGWAVTATALLDTCGSTPGSVPAADGAWGVTLARIRSGAPLSASTSSESDLHHVLARYGERLAAREGG